MGKYKVGDKVLLVRSNNLVWGTHRLVMDAFLTERVCTIMRTENENNIYSGYDGGVSLDIPVLENGNEWWVKEYDVKFAKRGRPPGRKSMKKWVLA